MSSSDALPDLPICGIKVPRTPLLLAALDYSKKHTSPTTVNHCLRSAYFALLIMRKTFPSSDNDIDIELVILAAILHDLGWATTKSLLSADKRFEVDGANLARSFVHEHADLAAWDKHRVQLLWDTIALHTSASIARYKEPEVATTMSGIISDFGGPMTLGGLIGEEEYKEILGTFPFLGFGDELVDIMCGLCREKRETTFDNFVSGYGLNFGLDGKGSGKAEYEKAYKESQMALKLHAGLKQLEAAYGGK